MKKLIKKILWFLKNYKKIYPDKLFIDNVFYGDITYAADGIVTSTNADFVNEPKFANAYQLAEKTKPGPGFNMPWRVYIVCWLANHVKKLEGHFVECGVNTGAYSRAIIDYIDFNSLNKTFYLFDTFEGLVKEQVTEEELNAGIKDYIGHYKNVYEQVVATFKPFSTKIIKGIVPETLTQFNSNKVCYLSIDMNVVAPEIAAAEFFWDKLIPGAVMILDDYGFPMHIQQKIAFDKFAYKKKVDILRLPTGQAIIFKP